MKKARMLCCAAVALMVAVVTSCVSKSQRFEALDGMEGVTTVRVGSAVTGMANIALKSGNEAEQKGTDDMARYLTSIEDIEVVNCDNAESIADVVAKCDSIISSMNYTAVINTDNGDGSKAKIYAGLKNEFDRKTADGLIVVEMSENSYNLVYMKGKVDLEKLMREINP